MCGIVGIIGDSSAEEIENLLSIISHRGKDHIGIYSRDSVGIHVGFNRLAINDLSEYSNQPFIKDNLIVLFNGELYNTKANGFEKELDFIVAAYKTGKPIKYILEGQYAIVIIDLKKQQLMMTRDLWGIVPLYYGYNTGEQLIFGSEKKAIQSKVLGGIQELAPFETRTYYNISGGTKGIRTDIEAGRRSLLNMGKFNQVIALELLKQAISKRCEHTDVGYSVALSGGLDSSLIAKLMHSMGMQVLAHTVGFEGGDDVAYATRLAAELGIKHQVHYVTKQQILDELPKLLYHLEDPVPNPIKLLAYIRNYYVAKFSKSKVIISGEGSDELFGGYPFFKATDTPIELSLKRQSAIKSMRAINLDRVDRGGMAWTKEYRMPFLDYQLANYVLSCPVIAGKLELRQIAAAVGLPEYIINRPKYGADENIFKAVFEEASKIWRGPHTDGPIVGPFVV